MLKQILDRIKNIWKYIRLFILYICSFILISCSETIATTDSGSTLRDGDFSFSIGSLAGETNALAIEPTNTATTVKYKFKAIKTAEFGSVTYNEFITASSKMHYGYPSFTVDDAFTLEFFALSDTYDISVKVYDYLSTTML